MNHLDLFAGIGGFARALDAQGFPVTRRFYSDIEPYALGIYAKQYPDAVALGDITKIDFNQLKATYGNEWIITGGFPCQDISTAGKGRGIIAGETRSGLWYEMLRAICELRPRVVIAENVAAILGRGLDVVLATLAESGYNAEWQIIAARDVDAPHRRDRIWIVAYPDNNGQS